MWTQSSHRSFCIVFSGLVQQGEDLRKTTPQPIQCKDMCRMYFTVSWQMVTDDRVTRTDASV